MRLKTFVLTAVATAAFLTGIWFFASPSLNRQADIEAQNELLDSIIAAMDGQGVSSEETELPHEAVIYYERTETAGYETYTLPFYVSEPFYESYMPEESICEPEPTLRPTPAPVPLDPSAFPNGITPLGILTIESINLRLPIMEGVDEPELRIAPGRVPQTAQIGEIGNAVIAGHRNFTFGSMFNRLGEIEIGDIIGFQAMNGTEMSFEVFEILIILPENQIAFIQPKNEAIITLYTCTPIREATHRLLIRANKIEGGF